MTTSTVPTTTARGGRERAGVLLSIILVSYFMIVLDNSIVFTGLARIREELQFSTAGLSWVQTSYALTFGGLLLLGARAGDLLGRRRVFVAGLVIFSVASLAIGLAPSGGFMIAARAVQGVGSAILAPTGLALLTASFPEGPERTRAVAAYGTIAGLGASVGLVLGGFLADLASWRVGFLINVPIGLVLVLAALRFVAPSEPTRGRFDIAGALTSTASMAALVYAVTRTSETSWADPLALVLLAAGVVLLIVFVAIEAKVDQPILPLRVFVHRARAGAFIARMLFAGAIFGYFFFVSQYMQSVLGFTPLQAGIAFLPMTVVQFAVALNVPRLTRRAGNPLLVVTGLTIAAAGMLWLSTVNADSTYWAAVAGPMLLLGLGQGLGFAPLTAAGITAVDGRDAGAASGTVNVAHQLGGALGVSVMVAAASSNADLAAKTSIGLFTGALLLIGSLIASAALILPWPFSFRAHRKASL